MIITLRNEQGAYFAEVEAANIDEAAAAFATEYCGAGWIISWNDIRGNGFTRKATFYDGLDGGYELFL